MIRPPFPDPNFVIMELIFSTIVIVLAMLIYFKTKEMYSLTKYKGIRYFRNSFLFFALAFFFRFFFHLFMMSRIGDAGISHGIMGPLSLTITSYLSTMAIFYLVLSTLWKYMKSNALLYIAHAAAALIVLMVGYFRTPEILGLAQLVLLVFAAVLSFLSYRKTKKHSQLFVIYILMFIIWVFNIFVLGPFRFLPFELRMLSLIITLVLFGIIYFKVKKWVR
jgi:hypothetical protein